MKKRASEAVSDECSLKVGVEDLGYLLVEVSKLHRVQAHKVLEELGLYRGQNFVLAVLSEQEWLAQSELAEKLLVRPPTVSDSLDRMEDAGWIDRQPDPRDRRIARVYLTDKGKVLQELASSLWRELETNTFAGLNAGEKHQLWRLLLKIRKNLGQGSEPLGCQSRTERKAVE